MENVRIRISEFIRNDTAVTSEEGENLYVKISEALGNRQAVILDFATISLVTPTFLNAAVGQLYGTYDSAFLKVYLKQDNMPREDRLLLKKVIDNARRYFGKDTL